MIYNVLLVIQILVALSIIGLVLLQHGKGADAGAAFGGGASGTVFGARGSGNFLSRTTAILAAVFFANSLLLAWMVSHPESAAVKSVVPTSVTDTITTPDKNETVAVPSDVPQAIEAVEKTDGVTVPESGEASGAIKDTKPADVPQ